MKKVFQDGPISATFIGNSIAKHQSKTSIGAHDIFLGQVRADQHPEGTVTGIEYSAEITMAEEKFHEIREATFSKYALTCMHIYHSLGLVKTGELCLFIFVSAPHRKVVFEAIEYIVERIKKEVPIFGKEILENEQHRWKVNI